jgi:hypothetical protein
LILPGVAVGVAIVVISELGKHPGAEDYPELGLAEVNLKSGCRPGRALM